MSFCFAFQMFYKYPIKVDVADVKLSGKNQSRPQKVPDKLDAVDVSETVLFLAGDACGVASEPPSASISGKSNPRPGGEGLFDDS